MKLADLVPINLEEEKEKFLTDLSYNPQFRYKNPIDRNFLVKYGLPDAKVAKQLEKELFGVKYTSTGSDEEGLSQDEICDEIENLGKKLGLGEIKVRFNPDLLSIAKVSKEPLRIELATRKIGRSMLRKILNHELQTHYLRYYNQRLIGQKVRQTRTRLLTEEGLASINGALAVESTSFIKSRLHYLGVYCASLYSFAGTFAKLRKFYPSDESTWRATLRYKRGLENTALPGGFTKDLVYYEGVKLVVTWLKNKENDPRALYWGKTDISQLSATPLAYNFIYPDFMADMGKYREFVERIEI